MNASGNNKIDPILRGIYGIFWSWPMFEFLRWLGVQNGLMVLAILGAWMMPGWWIYTVLGRIIRMWRWHRELGEVLKTTPAKRGPFNRIFSLRRGRGHYGL